MTNITYLNSTLPELRQSMPMGELLQRLSILSESWIHPILGKFADILYETITDYQYNKYQQATMKDFSDDIYNVVYELCGWDSFADTTAYKITKIIYGNK